MRTGPLLLASLLALQPAAAAAATAGEGVVVDTETITVTAPRDREVSALKTARATGAAAAAGGLGLLGYFAWASPAGPIGWAAALVFVGGMTFYLSHRRLGGQDDFSPPGASRLTNTQRPLEPQYTKPDDSTSTSSPSRSGAERSSAR